jgi:hypothetical protein
MPTLSTLIAASVLIPLGIGLVVTILVLLLRPVAAPAMAAVERRRFVRLLARTARIDEHLRAGRRHAALREIPHAFATFTIRADTRLAAAVATHHTGLLSRILTLTEALPQSRVRLLSLAKVDRLITRRTDLQHALLQLHSASLRDGRRIQLVRELRRNGSDLRAAVRELLDDVELLAARRVAIQ